jgi:hypothetical protein
MVQTVHVTCSSQARWHVWTSWAACRQWKKSESHSALSDTPISAPYGITGADARPNWREKANPSCRPLAFAALTNVRFPDVRWRSPLSRADELDSNRRLPFWKDRPYPLIGTQSCPHGVFNAPVFHGAPPLRCMPRKHMYSVELASDSPPYRLPFGLRSSKPTSRPPPIPMPERAFDPSGALIGNSAGADAPTMYRCPHQRCNGPTGSAFESSEVLIATSRIARGRYGSGAK